MTERTWFPSGRERCAAWVTLPEGPPPHPVVVLAHGGGAVHDMKLQQYEHAFSAAGLAVVAFDYRHFGASDGQPRQLLSVRHQLQDLDAALAFATSHPALDFPPLFDKMVADQVGFLRHHLKADTPDPTGGVA